MSAATMNEMERLRRERDEAIAERDALAANVEEAKRIFEDAPEVDPHPHGWVLAVDIAAAQDWIDATPAHSLARQKAEWQAEALEEEADCIMAEAGYLEDFRREVAGRLRYRARLRRQAAVGELMCL